MASPLWMLEKTRRTRLQGSLDERCDRERMSFWRDVLKEVTADLESSDSLPPLASHSSENHASKLQVPPKKDVPPSDFELMTTMMQRVSLLEKMVRSQAQEIKHKDKMISALEEKLKLLNESESTPDLCSLGNLARMCQRLQNQVCEMESFLNDYGMIWIGEENGDDSAEIEQPRNVANVRLHPGASPPRSFHMNFDLVLQRIQELNILARDGESFVRPTANGAELAKKDAVPLSLYSNGIVMFDGPFRSYQDHSTQQCMRDLMDGYFPSELKERFPDGTPFEVHDRRHQEFTSRLLRNKWLVDGHGGHGDISGKKLSVEQFLRRVPKVAIKAGCVIDIRNSLRDTLQGSSNSQNSSSVIIIDTGAQPVDQKRAQIFSPNQPASTCDVTTLKVKSEDGCHTFILKMSLSETIGDLRWYLDKHREDSLPDYDIISMCPWRCYDDDCQTLQSCGLKSNTTLLLQKRKC